MKSFTLLTLFTIGLIQNLYGQLTNNELLIDGGTLKVTGTFYWNAWDESAEVEHPYLWLCNQKQISSLPIVKIETRINSKSFDLTKLPENSYSVENGKFELEESFYNRFYEVVLVSKRYYNENFKAYDWTFDVVSLNPINQTPECFSNVPKSIKFSINIVDNAFWGESCTISFQEEGKPIITKDVDCHLSWQTIGKLEDADTTTYGIKNLELTFETYALEDFRNIQYNYDIKLDELLVDKSDDYNDVLDRFEDFIIEFEKAVKSQNMERILQLSDLESFKTHDAGIGPKELIEMEGWSQIEMALASGVDEDYYEAFTRNDYPRLIFYKAEQYENWKWVGIELD